jgi:hypothetical protein
MMKKSQFFWNAMNITLIGYCFVRFPDLTLVCQENHMQVVIDVILNFTLLKLTQEQCYKEIIFGICVVASLFCFCSTCPFFFFISDFIIPVFFAVSPKAKYQKHQTIFKILLFHWSW